MHIEGRKPQGPVSWSIENQTCHRRRIYLEPWWRAHLAAILSVDSLHHHFRTVWNAKLPWSIVTAWNSLLMSCMNGNYVRKDRRYETLSRNALY